MQFTCIELTETIFAIAGQFVPMYFKQTFCNPYFIFDFNPSFSFSVGDMVWSFRS